MTEKQKYGVSSPTLRAKEYKLSRFMYILQRNFEFMLRLDSKAYIGSDSVVCQYLAWRSLLLLSLLWELPHVMKASLHSLLEPKIGKRRHGDG